MLSWNTSCPPPNHNFDKDNNSDQASITSFQMIKNIKFKLKFLIGFSGKKTCLLMVKDLPKGASSRIWFPIPIQVINNGRIASSRKFLDMN